MASGYRSGGVDFDDLFEAGAVVASSTLRRQGGGVLQYAARGSATKRPNVGLRVAGSDVSNLWLPKGAAPPVPGFDGKEYRSVAGALLQSTGMTRATVRLQLNPDGTWRAEAQNANSSDDTLHVLESGTWLPTGQSAADYTVQFVVGPGSGNPTVTTNAATPSPFSVLRKVEAYIEAPAQGHVVESGDRTVSVILTRTGGGSTGSTVFLAVTASSYGV